MTQSQFIHGCKINVTSNFPIGIITQINPLLNKKFKATKSITRQQEKTHDKHLNYPRYDKKSLIIESDDINIVNEVKYLSEYIHHHTTVS